MVTGITASIPSTCWTGFKPYFGYKPHRTWIPSSHLLTAEWKETTPWEDPAVGVIPRPTVADLYRFDVVFDKMKASATRADSEKQGPVSNDSGPGGT